jgi:steroid delta-isomerase-like uncharacterized protein
VLERDLRTLVEEFYADVWNGWNDVAIDRVLDERFVFRGSLGDEVRGRDGFRGYRDKIRVAFPDFHNEIVDLVVGDGKAAARLLYTGTHMGEALGVPASGAAISYSGAAFFRADGGRLRQAWVLGDLDQLRRQLTGSG